MLKPTLQVRMLDGMLMAEFWDCLRLDPEPVKALRAAFDAHIRQGGRPIVLVDLSGVDFAGSTALSGFVGLRKAGARLIFYNVDPTVREVFRVSNLDALFGFAANLETAQAVAAGTDPNLAVLSTGSTSQESVSPEQRSSPPRGSSPPLRRSRRPNG
jgi:anti-anti-sigma factor